MPRFEPNERAIHYAKHRADFPAITEVQYEQAAERFLLAPLHSDLLECKRQRGDIVRYDKVTGEFAVLSATGMIRTYFRPIPCASVPRGAPLVGCHGETDNVAYFNKECAK